MPELGFQALAVLFVLLPGFLSAYIVQSLCVRPQQTELDKVVEAFLYSFLIYVVFASLGAPIPVALRVESAGGATLYSIETKPIHLLVLGLISISFALAVAATLNNDLHTRLLRKFHITQRTSRASIWSDVFHQFSGYAVVELVDGRLVLGWLRLYSDTPENASLFLEDAAWIMRDGSREKIEGPGIFLTKSSGIRSIAFLDPKESQTT